MLTARASISQRLVQRLVDARGKQKLEILLARRKRERDLGVRAFRTQGDAEQLTEAVATAIRDRHLTLIEIARLVDEVEENGGQHVFLFDITPAGHAALNPEFIRENFRAYPAQPTEELYAELPQQNRIFYRDDGGIITLKEVGTADYWEIDRAASEKTEDREVQVRVRRRRRVVNVARIDPATRRVEVRIDRITDAVGDPRALEEFERFMERIAPAIDMIQHLTPVPIWNGFDEIARARDETFMNIDEAEDGSVTQTFSSRRAGTRGRDVRDHHDYRLSGDEYHRSGLRVFWRVGAGEEERNIFTTLTAPTVGETMIGKVYVSAKVSPADLEHVLNRIREFAEAAP